MQLKITTDYAIRAVIFIASSQGMKSSKEISDNMSIPREYFIQISKTLREAGILTTYPGKNGGYELAKPADEISLYDIIAVMEGSTRINRCLEDDKYCGRLATQECAVREVYEFLQEHFEKVLKSATIGKLASGEKLNLEF